MGSKAHNVAPNPDSDNKQPVDKGQNPKQIDDSLHAERLSLIKQIQENRKSKLITYICGNRQGAPQAQIAEDVIRPMYDHLRAIGSSKKIDLFLYSKGGAIEVPWRMVTMLREYCDHLSILIPYYSQSAATLIALGCDEIVMGEKAELGPIDPTITFGQNDRTEVQKVIGVEDIMSFTRFIKKFGNKKAVIENMAKLIEKLNPWDIGKIYRTHSHVRMVAKRMIEVCNNPISRKVRNSVIKTLAEEIYSHGHAICRKEASEIGLPVQEASTELDRLMWELFGKYEKLLNLREPIDPNSQFTNGLDEKIIDLILAVIESEEKTSIFNGYLRFKRIRNTPPNVNINLNMSFQLPPNIPPDQIPQELQQTVQRQLQQLQKQAPQWVMEQTKQQSPILKIEGRFENGAWRDINDL